MLIRTKYIDCISKNVFKTWKLPTSQSDLNGDISWSAVVYIQDTGEIWTHGKLYGGFYSNADTNKVTLTIGGSAKNISLDGHTQSYTTLTGSTSIANQVIISTGVQNQWTLKTLGKHAFSNEDYLLADGTAEAAKKVVNPFSVLCNNNSLLSFDGSSAKQLNIIQGNNVVISGDSQGNITIAADSGNDTVNTAGATNLINKKLFLIGAGSQTTAPQTYSNQYVYIGTDNCLYSLGKKVLTEHQAIYGLNIQTLVGSTPTKVVSYNPDTANETFTIAQGTNITLTPDSSNKKITISSKDTTYNFYNLVFKHGDVVVDTYKPTTSPNKVFKSGTNVTLSKSGDDIVISTQDTKNTVGSTEKLTTKLFLVGTTTQTSASQSFSNSKVFIGTDNKLYSNGKEVSTVGHTHNYAGSQSPGGPANHLAGGSKGSIPYQTSSGQTTMLAPATVNGYVLKFNTSTGLPYWAVDINTTYVTKVLKVNNTSYNVYTSSASLPTIWAPSSLGSANQVLKVNSTGDGLTWGTDSNTDTKVLQSETTTANYRPLILGYTNKATTSELDASVTNQVYVSNLFYAKPSTGELWATKLYSGNSEVLTKGNYTSTLDDRYVTLSTAQTITGIKTFSKQIQFDGVSGISLNYDADTSTALAIAVTKNTSGSITSSIFYHNTAKRLIFNAIGASETYNDALGKYSFIVGNNELKYNTYNILHTGNYTSTLDSRYVKKAGDTMTGSLTLPSDGAFTNGRLRFGTNSRIGSDANGNLGIYAGGNDIYIRPDSKDAASTKGVLITATSFTYNNNKIWHAGNDGSGSGLDADTLDRLHASDLRYTQIYNPVNGILIQSDIGSSNNAMINARITGNSYSAGKIINTYFEAYNYQTSNTILNARAINYGLNISYINVFNYNGKVCLWIPKQASYESFSVYLETTSISYPGNRVSSITDAAMPTTGVTRLVKVIPLRAALITDNVASATKLQTPRTIWGQSFDGTANVSGSMSGVGRITFNSADIYLTDPSGYNILTRQSKNLFVQSNAGGYLSLGFRGTSYIDFYGGVTEASTAGTALGRWNTTGLGIGTTSPSYKLHVVGNIYTSGLFTAESYVYSRNGWFQNNKSGTGLYNSAHDARWYANSNGWYADKAATFAGYVTSTGFKKSSSSDSYVLLGGGGHKLLSELQTTYDGRYVGGNKQANHGTTATSYTADTYSSTFVNKNYVAFAERGSWNYANNGYVTTDFGNIHLAGTAVFQWGANDTYKTQLFITPLNASGVTSPLLGEMLYYSSNGDNYNKGWTRVVTNRNYTSIITKIGIATVGSATKPIYLNAGTPTASNATVGTASRPIYMSGGNLVAGTYTFGNAKGNAAINNGTVNTNLNADMLDGVHNGSVTAKFLNYSTTYTWDCNAPTATLHRNYGEANTTVSNKPSGWVYGQLLTIGSKGSLNENLSAQFIWDVQHNTKNPGILWFRTRDSANGWAKNWGRLAFITDKVSGAQVADKLGTTTKGSATKGIYLNAGSPVAMTYSLAATVNSGATNKLAYYSSATAINDWTTNVGSSTLPIYINAGTPIACSSTLGVSITGSAYDLKIHDIRDTNPAPNASGDKRIRAWFNNTGTPNSAWWSGITVSGWQSANNYAVWQLAGYSSNTSSETNLYYRRGLGSTWGSWRVVLDSSNYTSYVKKIGITTVGATNKPIYLNAGTPTALSATQGSTALPVYLSAGSIVACTASSIFSNLSNSGNNISITIAGQNRTLTLAYASASGYARKLYRIDSTGRNWTTAADIVGNGIVAYTDTTTSGRWTSYGSVLQFSNQDNPDPGVSNHWVTQIWSGTDNKLGVRWRTNTGAWSAMQTILTTSNYTSNLDSRYVTIGTAQTITATKIFSQDAASVVYVKNNAASNTSNYVALRFYHGDSDVGGIAGDKNGSALYRVNSGFTNVYKLLDTSNYTTTLDTRYVKKTGDTMTGNLTVPIINLTNTSGIKFDGKTYSIVALEGSNSLLGMMENTTYIRSGNTNLYHRKSGSNYIIWDSSNGGAGSGLDADKLDGLHASTFMRATNANGFYGLTTPAGSSSDWVRTTVNGIIPYQSGGSTAGHGSLGTSSWYFKAAYIQNIYGTLNGNAGSATYSTSVSVTDITVADLNSGTRAGQSRLKVYESYNQSGTPTTYGNIIEISSTRSNHWQPQLWLSSGTTGHIYYRNKDYNTAFGSWRAILDSGNYTSYVTKIGTATVGSTTKPIYLNAGTPTASNATVGSATRPVYMNAGTITAGTYTFGNASGNAAISNGTVCTNLNADKLDGYNASSFESYKLVVIDASALNNNTWYPVTMSIGGSLQTRIRIEGITSANASWNTRSDKMMALILDYTVNGSQWGWTTVSRVIYQYMEGAGTSSCLGGLGQLTNSSTEYVFVRGGAKYNFYVSRFITPVLRTSTYTISSQSVSPTTTKPSSISINNALITSNVASATKLATARTIWGRPFDGTANVSGALTEVTDITSSGNIKTTSLYANNGGYVYTDSGWFQNNKAGTGLYNKAENARWYASGGVWRADKGITTTGDITTNRIKITDTDAVKHIEFSRVNYNYITAPSGGIISFNTEGSAATGTSDLQIQSGSIHSGTTNATSCGTSIYRWSNVYSVLGNFSGAVTMSSSLTVGSTLSVSGALKLNQTLYLYNSNDTYRLTQTISNTSSLARIYMINEAGNAYGDLSLGHSGSNAIYIKGGNNVGIGTSSPSYKLHVAGTFRVSDSASLGSTLTVTGAATLSSTLNVANTLTASNGIVTDYDSGTWISLATRYNLIRSATNNSASGAHALFRVKNSGGDAIVFGGLGTHCGFYGFTAETISAGTNLFNWATHWDVATGKLTHNKTMEVSGAVTLSSTLSVASTSTFKGRSTHNGGVTSNNGIIISSGEILFNNASYAQKISRGISSTTWSAIEYLPKLTTNGNYSDVLLNIQSSHTIQFQSGSKFVWISKGNIFVQDTVDTSDANVRSTLTIQGTSTFKQAATFSKLSTFSEGLKSTTGTFSNTVSTAYLNVTSTATFTSTISAKGGVFVPFNQSFHTQNKAGTYFPLAHIDSDNYCAFGSREVAAGTVINGYSGILFNLNNKTNFVRIYASGLECDGTISASNVSDIRLKKDITIPDYQKKLLALGQVVDFYYTKKGLRKSIAALEDRKYTGLIYQNVKNVLPQMTSTDVEGYGKLNYIHTDYINLIAGALQQTITKQIDINIKIAKLEQENNKLKEEVNELKSKLLKSNKVTIN